MPVFDFFCGCGKERSDVIARPDERIVCPACGRRMQKRPPLVHHSMGAAGAYGYHAANLGVYVHTNAQRREEMRRQGVTERGATPKNGEAWV